MKAADLLQVHVGHRFQDAFGQFVYLGADMTGHPCGRYDDGKTDERPIVRRLDQTMDVLPLNSPEVKKVKDFWQALATVMPKADVEECVATLEALCNGLDEHFGGSSWDESHDAALVKGRLLIKKIRQQYKV